MNIFERISRMFNASRQKVHTSNYDGEDRRSFQQFFVGPDRRKHRARNHLFPK